MVGLGPKQSLFELQNITLQLCRWYFNDCGKKANINFCGLTVLCIFQTCFVFRLIDFMRRKLLWKKQFQFYENIFLSPKEKNRGFKVVALRSLPISPSISSPLSFFLSKSFSLWQAFFCHVAVVTIWEYQCLNDTFL